MTQSIGGTPSIQNYGAPQRPTELPTEPIGIDEGASPSPVAAGDRVSAQGMGTGSASSLSLDDFGLDAVESHFAPEANEDLDEFVGPLADLDEAPAANAQLSQEDLQEQIIQNLLSPLPSVTYPSSATSFREVDHFQRAQLIQNIKNDPALQEAFENWDKLGYAAKMQAGVRISDMQAHSYGFPAAPLRLEADLVKDPNLYGFYSSGNGTVSISPHRLGDLAEFVNTIVHEQAHAYQYFLVGDAKRAVDEGKVDESHFMVEMARVFRGNFMNYVSGDEDYTAYRTQPIEAHAWATGDGVTNGVFDK